MLAVASCPWNRAGVPRDTSRSAGFEPAVRARAARLGRGCPRAAVAGPFDVAYVLPNSIRQRRCRGWPGSRGASASGEDAGDCSTSGWPTSTAARRWWRGLRARQRAPPGQRRPRLSVGRQRVAAATAAAGLSRRARTGLSRLAPNTTGQSAGRRATPELAQAVTTRAASRCRCSARQGGRALRRGIAQLAPGACQVLGPDHARRGDRADHAARAWSATTPGLMHVAAAFGVPGRRVRLDEEQYAAAQPRAARVLWLKEELGSTARRVSNASAASVTSRCSGPSFSPERAHMQRWPTRRRLEPWAASYNPANHGAPARIHPHVVVPRPPGHRPRGLRPALRGGLQHHRLAAVRRPA